MIRLALLAGVVVTMLATAATARPLVILPLGDSITQGGRADREEYTYRFPLFQMLTDAGVEFDFIGSMRSGLQPGARWPDHDGKPMDLDHEGHYGWKTAQIRDQLRGWVRDYPAAPDIVLIHIGTNDQGAAKAATTPSPEDPAKQVTDEALERKLYDEAIIQPLADVIAILRERNPNVVVLLGHLNFNAGAATRIRPLVEELSARLDTPESPVRTVHHYRGWIEDPSKPDTDTFDWAHPNPSGQRKMAQNWLEAMRPFLDRAK